MKNLSLSFFVLISLLVIGCNSEPKPEANAPTSAPTINQPTKVSPSTNGSKIGDVSFADGAQPVNKPAARPVEPPQNAGGVWHFTCPKGCTGGAGVAKLCGNCGTKLQHNQGYHKSSAPNTSPDVIGTQPQFNQNAQPRKVEPAQNAKGVWHFTCAKGCTGGAGKAVACKTCGGILQHNQGYH